MFSFIKFIQAKLNQIKRNKGLWFTALTLLSVAGILTSMYLINYMSEDVKRKTYAYVYEKNVETLEQILDATYDYLLSIGGTVAIHPDLIANIKTQSDKSINDLLRYTQQTINERVHIEPIKIRYYAKSYTASDAQNKQYAELVMESKTSLSGIVVNTDGVRLVGITPIFDKNVSIGAIEISQDISAIKSNMEKLGKEFVFLLDKSQLIFLSLETKQGMLQDISERYKIFFHKYNPQFFTHLRKLDLEQLDRQKYFVDQSYFTSFDETIDIDGKKIGLFVIGESTKETNSFVNITQNLINSITTVALGLVISLILFMF